jgi:hypothetical protein
VTTCELCGRHLLVGERFRSWQRGDGSGRTAPLCSLCEPQAVASGWARTTGKAERQGTPAPVWTVRLVESPI